MQPWFQRQSREVRLIVVGIALLAITGVIVVLATGGSGGKSDATTPAEEARIDREVEEFREEFKAEERREASDPTKSRNIEEMIVLHPRNEEATEAQLRRQILTNAESTDPTHEHEAFCGMSSSYRNYDHYLCQAYTTSGQGGYGRFEVTVDENTGAVLVEPSAE